jgi:hypothetical protein
MGFGTTFVKSAATAKAAAAKPASAMKPASSKASGVHLLDEKQRSQQPSEQNGNA